MLRNIFPDCSVKYVITYGPIREVPYGMTDRTDAWNLEPCSLVLKRCTFGLFAFN
jgi:hypothetical protein